MIGKKFWFFVPGGEKKEEPMKIGSVELNTRLALAPMAGVTDLAFRSVCRELSG